MAFLSVAVALAAFLAVFQDILPPFIAGLGLAYLLNPAAAFLERAGWPRALAAAFILVVAALSLLLLLLMVAPLMGAQLGRLAENLPDYARTLGLLYEARAPALLKHAIAGGLAAEPDQLSGLAGKAAVWLGDVVRSLWSGGMTVIHFLSLAVITPIVTFYLLNDWNRLLAGADSWLPRDHAPAMRRIARDIDKAMAGFIRGQSLVCLALGVFYAATLTAAGLDFGLLIGVTAGVLSFIPYVGAILGGGLSVGMAVAQFWPDWTPMAVIVAIFAAGQILEGHILSPKLVGNRVGLHPVWMIFALMAFAQLFGLAGLLIAIPAAAAIAVLCRHGIRSYLAGTLYAGNAPGQG